MEVVGAGVVLGEAAVVGEEGVSWEGEVVVG